METFGDALRRIRKSKNPKITTTMLAKEIGVVQSFITEVETNKKFPTPEKFELIITFLGENVKLRALYDMYRKSSNINKDFIEEIKSIKEENFLKSELLSKAMELKETERKAFISGLLNEYCSSHDEKFRASIYQKFDKTSRDFQRQSNRIISEIDNIIHDLLKHKKAP